MNANKRGQPAPLVDVSNHLRNPSWMTWQKKYSWRVTWPGEGHEDWVAHDGDLYIGRIMRDKTTHGKAGSFLWSGGAHGRDFKHHVMPHQGWEQEHWKAAQAVEDWYDRMRERNGLPAR